MDGHNGVPVATFREQTVEIALGPKGAFENGNVGTMARRVRAELVVSAVPRSRRAPKPPRGPRTPRVAELLRKAIEWRALLESGEAANQAEIARKEGITRARVTQLMGLLRFPPEIQQHVMGLPGTIRRSAITERALRPITQLENLTDQKVKFQALFEHVGQAKLDSCGATIASDSQNLMPTQRCRRQVV